MIRPVEGGCLLTLRVHPGARRNAITGVHDSALKISLTTPPADGRANEALIAFLSEEVGIPRARIHLTRGQTSRSKTVRLEGMSAEEVTAKLMPAGKV